MNLAENVHERAAIEKNMMKAPYNIKIALCELEQSDTHQGVLSQLKASLAINQKVCLEAPVLLVRAQRTPVLSAEAQSSVFVDSLLRLVEVFPVKAGSEDGVSIDNPLPGCLKCLEIEIGLNSENQLLDIDAGLSIVKSMEEHSML